MAIINLVKKFESEYFQRLNLVASENIGSPDMREALQSDLNHRYAIPPEDERHPGIWEYPNQSAIRDIIRKTEIIACDLFHAEQANTFPLSGNQIASIMLTSLLKKDDVFLSVGPDCGGHFTTEEIAIEQGYNRFDIAYNRSEGIMDVEKTAKKVRDTGAKLVFLDASMILFPYPVRDLRSAIGDDVIISYDASHTLGMIAGGKFQSPLEEGADFLHGSTHKSLWGPQKGLILSARHADQDHNANKVFSRIVPNFASNVHPHHIAALGIALEESKEFGDIYTNHIIKNAHALGKTLSDRGLDVAFAEKNYTNCHQVIVKIGDKDTAYSAFHRLEESNINVNAISIPYCQENNKQYGLRIGLSEITRRGMDVRITQNISDLIADAILETRPTNIIKNDVIAISQAHRVVYYNNSETPLARKGPAPSWTTTDAANQNVDGHDNSSLEQDTI